MGSKRKARLVREKAEEFDARLSKMVVDDVAAGTATPSFHSALLEREQAGKSELTPFQRDSLSGLVTIVRQL